MMRFLRAPVFFSLFFSFAVLARPIPPKWAYDPGPDPNNPMQRELIDIIAEIPFMPGISEQISIASNVNRGKGHFVFPKQKFRPAFGPVPYRMSLEPNSVKILVIGQDATHIAEAAGRPAVASFGGRAHDIANYLGVDQSLAFINAFAFTIKGQYGSFSHPFIDTSKGFPRILYGSFVDNGLWMLSQDQGGPITKWRNRLIDWIFRNNQSSLKMVMTLGGGAKDAISAFAVSKGAKVNPRVSGKDLSVPETALVFAGGNNEYPALLDNEGKDLYVELYGKEPRYSSRGKKKYVSPEDLDEFLAKERKKLEKKGKDEDEIAKALKKAKSKKLKGTIKLKEILANEKHVASRGIKDEQFKQLQKVIRTGNLKEFDIQAVNMLFKNNAKKLIKQGRINETKGGDMEGGFIHPAQLRGYDTDNMWVNGEKTISLKGLHLSDRRAIQNDVLVVPMAHPSSLSRIRGKNAKKKVSRKVAKALARVEPYIKKGWKIKADEGWEDAGFWKEKREPYEYRYGKIGAWYHEFGVPGNRMVPISTAYRMGSMKRPYSGDKKVSYAHVIVFGTRDKSKFDMDVIDYITDAPQPAGIHPDEMPTARTRVKPNRYDFDRGPGLDWAKTMITNLPPRSEVFTPKIPMSLKLRAKAKAKRAEIARRKNDKDNPISQKEVDEIEEGILQNHVDEVFNKHGIVAFNVKSHADADDFGHFRGTFKRPRVLIVADPHGYDDIRSARALTGARGQYIQGLMNDMGIKDKYLVIKTVPWAMDGATDFEWSKVLKATRKSGYLEAIFDKLLLEEKGANVPEVILTDGKFATKEVKRILKGYKNAPQRFTIYRRRGSLGYGIRAMGKKLTQLGFKGTPKVEMAPIPNSHKSFYVRVPSGTGGDSVITSMDKRRGKAFAMVMQKWATGWEVEIEENNQILVDEQLERLEDLGLRTPHESIPELRERLDLRGESGWEAFLKWAQPKEKKAVGF